MLAIALHSPEIRIDDYQRGLKYENIELHGISWDCESELDSKIFDANIVIIALKSPEITIMTRGLNQLKKKKKYMPVIIMDEVDSDETRVCALSLGAYNYFSKPIFYRDVAIVMKHLAFRTDQPKNKCLSAFDMKLDLEHRFVKRESHGSQLRNKEFALLEFFMMNRGKVLTRNSILEHVWDRNANFASNTVDVHINRLRRKIDDPFKEKLIHTIHCVGYIFEKRRKNGK